MSISAQASAEKASGVVWCLRGERVRHEEDDTESLKLKPERKRAAIGQGSVPCMMRFWRKSGERVQETQERTDLVDGVEPRRPTEENRRAGGGRPASPSAAAWLSCILDCVMSPASSTISDASEILVVKP